MKRLFCFIIFLTTCAFYLSCNSTKKQVVKTGNIEKVSKEKNPNAYLKIIGTEPFWDIEISDNKIVYSSIDGEVIEFPYNNPILNKQNNTITYKTVNGNGTIEIILTEENCSDGMSDREFNYSAKVEIIQKKITTKYKGCGYYLTNDNFNGNWKLIQFESKKIIDDKNSVVPFLEFDMENNRISGNAGCNGLSSKFILERNKIQFSEILLTKMFCENVSIENDFVKALGEITSYKINQNKLSLYNNDVLEMVFEKE